MEQEQDLIVKASNEKSITQDLAESAKRVRGLLKAITQRSRRNLEDAISIGQELQQAKEKLAHGQFGTWLQAECALSRTSATRYMQLARVFADKLSTMDNLPSLSVAFLVAQVSTPEAVRLAVLRGEIPDSPEIVRQVIDAERASSDEVESVSLDQEPEEKTNWAALAREYIQAISQPLIVPEQLARYRETLRQAPDMPEFHELTKVIPVMQIDEYASLVASLSLSGLVTPIKTFHGKIIDGRMRYLACREAGILPRFEEWNGQEDQILSFLQSMNFFRSHYSLSQQAIIALESEERMKQEAEELSSSNQAF